MAREAAFFRNITCFAFIFCGSFLILMWILFLRDTKGNSAQMDYLFNNWNNSLIYDIQLSQDFCTNGYQPVKLGNTDKVYSSSGSVSIDTYSIFTYRQSIICIKTDPRTYLDLSVDSSGCNSPCGNVDAIGNYICGLTTCPITDIMIIDSNYKTPAGYQRRDFLDGVKSLIFTKTAISGKTPIVNFQVTLGEKCAHPLEKGVDQSLIDSSWDNYSYYNKCKTTLAGYYLNPHFTWLDADYGANFLPQPYLTSINSMNSTTYSNIMVNFPLYNLYGEYYAGLNPDCLYSGSTLSALYSYNIYDNGPAILSCAILLSLMGFIGISLNACDLDNKCFYLFYFIVLFFLSAVTLTVSWVFYTYELNSVYTMYVNNFIVNTSTRDKSYNYMSLSDCLDNFSVEMVNLVFNHFSSFNLIFLLCSILITIASSYWIVIYLFACYSDCCFKIDVFD